MIFLTIVVLPRFDSPGPKLRNEPGRSLTHRTGTTSLLYIYGYRDLTTTLSGPLDR